MRFDDQVVFPHPVLRPTASDYAEGEFFDDIEVVSLPDDPKEPIVLKVAYSLKEPALERLVNEEQARVQVLVTCRDSFYNKLHDLSAGATEISLDPSLIHGSVNLITVLDATADLSGFRTPAFVDDFSGMSFDVPAGGFLAFCAPRVLYLEREAFGTAESVIELVQGPTADNQPIWSLDAEADKLRIVVQEAMMRDVSHARTHRLGMAALMNCLYVSAVQQAFELLKQSGGDDLLWKKVFRQRCEFLNLQIDNVDSSTAAQLILGLPLAGFLKQLNEGSHAH